MTTLEVLRGMRELFIKFDEAGDDDAVSATAFAELAIGVIDELRPMLDRAIAAAAKDQPDGK